MTRASCPCGVAGTWPGWPCHEVPSGTNEDSPAIHCWGPIAQSKPGVPSGTIERPILPAQGRNPPPCSTAAPAVHFRCRCDPGPPGLPTRPKAERRTPRGRCRIEPPSRLSRSERLWIPTIVLLSAGPILFRTKFRKRQNAIIPSTVRST